MGFRQIYSLASDFIRMAKWFEGGAFQTAISPALRNVFSPKAFALEQ